MLLKFLASSLDFFPSIKNATRPIAISECLHFTWKENHPCGMAEFGLRMDARITVLDQPALCIELKRTSKRVEN